MSKLVINLGLFKTMAKVIVVYQTHMYLDIGNVLLDKPSSFYHYASNGVLGL